MFCTLFYNCHQFELFTLLFFLLKALKRVSSYPASTNDANAQNKDPAIGAKPRRHEQTQSQHDSVETSAEFTLSSEIQHLDPSNTSVNSREPLISNSCASNGVMS